MQLGNLKERILDLGWLYAFNVGSENEKNAVKLLGFNTELSTLFRQ